MHLLARRITARIADRRAATAVATLRQEADGTEVVYTLRREDNGTQTVLPLTVSVVLHPAIVDCSHLRSEEAAARRMEQMDAEMLDSSPWANDNDTRRHREGVV